MAKLNAALAAPPPALVFTPNDAARGGMQSSSAAAGINNASGASTTDGKLTIKFPAGYDSRRRELDFMLLSYNGGPDYKYGLDSKGQKILIEHENERTTPISSGPNAPVTQTVDGKQTEGQLLAGKYNRRVRMATYENHVKPIQDKVRSYVLSCTPSRPEYATARVEELDLEMHLDRLLEDGLKFGEGWIGFDAAAIPKGSTAADAARIDPKNGGKPYIVRADPRCIVDWEIRGEVVTRVVIEETVTAKPSLVSDPKTTVRYREWTATEWVIWEKVEDDSRGEIVVKESGRGTHTFGRCPWFRLRPPFPTRDLCDLSRHLFNVMSLLDEEMYSNTFTQRYITGASVEQVAATDRGAGNTMVVDSPDARMGVLGSNEGQARSIMDRMARDVAAIYQLVSMDPTVKNVAESAEKKKRDLQSLYTMLTQIAEEIERVENDLLRAMEVYKSEESDARTKYNREFDVYSAQEILDQIALMAKVPFSSPRFKRRLVLAFIQKADPFGPHADYSADVDAMFDTSPELTAALAEMRRESILTADMLKVTLGVPDALFPDLEELMDEAAAQHASPFGAGFGGLPPAPGDKKEPPKEPGDAADHPNNPEPDLGEGSGGEPAAGNNTADDDGA